MKIKVNPNKETISIKGMTPMEFSVIETLLSHVRLGQSPYDNGASDAAYEFLAAVEAAAMDLDVLDMHDVSVSAGPGDEVDGTIVILEDPILEVYAN